ncbi:MAG TPA: hypothetical protein VIZ28_16020 [Chitinophagaceae bacterium]
MRIIISLVLITVFSPHYSSCQSQAFPQSWFGNWKGELQWYKGAAKEPRKVNMELRIHPTDSAGKYSWQIIYGNESKDNRPYLLIAKDTAKGHWAIDENNGIILDQFWVAGKFCGAFTVNSSTIVNNYWMESGRLVVEFYGLSGKPIATTGKGTEESPLVDSYKVSTYQIAVLTRQ